MLKSKLLAKRRRRREKTIKQRTRYKLSTTLQWVKRVQFMTNNNRIINQMSQRITRRSQRKYQKRNQRHLRSPTHQNNRKNKPKEPPRIQNQKTHYRILLTIHERTNKHIIFFCLIAGFLRRTSWKCKGIWICEPLTVCIWYRARCRRAWVRSLFRRWSGRSQWWWSIWGRVWSSQWRGWSSSSRSQG